MAFVYVRLERWRDQALDPFEGTKMISVTLQNDDCIRAFYDENPEYTSSGVLGEKIFGNEASGWFDECDADHGPPTVKCAVRALEQPAPEGSALTVTYAVGFWFNGHALPFGPLPSSLVPECVEPKVTLASLDAIRGTDENGKALWEIVWADPVSARIDLETTLRVRARRIEDEGEWRMRRPMIFRMRQEHLCAGPGTCYRCTRVLPPTAITTRCSGRLSLDRQRESEPGSAAGWPFGHKCRAV